MIKGASFEAAKLLKIGTGLLNYSETVQSNL